MGCATSRPDKNKEEVAKEEQKPVAEAANPTRYVAVDPPTTAEEVEVEDAPELPPEKKAAVVALFKQFDTAGNGMLPLDSLNSATVSVGPSEEGVLVSMKEMDFNGDGYVEESEWVVYFTAIGDALGDEEFDLIMTELKAAASMASAVDACVKLAVEEDESPEGLGADAAEGEAILQELLANLSPAQKKMIEALFAEWKSDSANGIEIAMLADTEVEGGPVKWKVFDKLKLMDANGDGIVELDEMMQYFAVVLAEMGDDEFTSTVDDMKEMAAGKKHLATMLQYAQEGAAQEDDYGDEVPEMPELTAERKALVKDLFLSFAADESKNIELASLTDVDLEVGPTKDKVLLRMEAMDANKDGWVEMGEMLEYFTIVGSELGDDDFTFIISGIKDGVSVKKALVVAEQVQ